MNDRIENTIFWLIVIGVFFVCAFLGVLLSSYYGLDNKVGILIVMVLAYCVFSVVVVIQRNKLKKKIETWATSDRKSVEEQLPEIKYLTSSGRWVALVGFLWVNGPIIPVIVGPLVLYKFYSTYEKVGVIGFPLILLGLFLSWLWWSVNVSLWRRWARKKGIHEKEIQWRGEDVSILCSKNSFSERMEFENILRRISCKRRKI